MAFEGRCLQYISALKFREMVQYSWRPHLALEDKNEVNCPPNNISWRKTHCHGEKDVLILETSLLLQEDPPAIFCTQLVSSTVAAQAFKRNKIDTNWLDGLIRERAVRLKYEHLVPKNSKDVHTDSFPKKCGYGSKMLHSQKLDGQISTEQFVYL